MHKPLPVAMSAQVKRKQDATLSCEIKREEDKSCEIEIEIGALS